MIERAVFRPQPEHATPRRIAAFLAEVFASLDAQPREVRVALDFREAGDFSPVTLDLEGGEPVLRQAGQRAAHAALHGRYLCEHPVPLALSQAVTHFRLVPTTGNRIKVRRVRCWLKFWNS